MSDEKKWVDLHPGKSHEFGTRVRVLGHARMNDGSVRLYYEEVSENLAVRRGPTEFGESAGILGQQLSPMQQQMVMSGGSISSAQAQGQSLNAQAHPPKEKSGSKKEK